MRLAIVYSRASLGVIAPLVNVEVHLSQGMPRFNIVGLPQKAVKESKDRVRSSIINANFIFPCRYITVNLAPADLPKEGGRFDLAIALGILAASGQIPLAALENYEVIGELALSGDIRPARSLLPVILGCKQAQRILIIPSQNCIEAGLVSGVKILAANHLLDVCAHLRGDKDLPAVRVQTDLQEVSELNFSEVKGQQYAKRALEIAACGGHNVLMIGPPGTGKSMLAARLPSILPQLSEEAAIEHASLVSLSGKTFDARVWRKIPYRSPHHSSTSIALVGGGVPPRPGEVSLAHQGILFLDELAEFSRQALEALREPLEAGEITISRAGIQITLPARFQLIAAMNPCPCGYAGAEGLACVCTENQIKKYMGKISGPLLDRIDIHLQVQRIADKCLFDNETNLETSSTIQKRVIATRKIQMQRQAKLNAKLTVADIKQFCVLPNEGKTLIMQAMKKFSLSARAIHKIQQLARTIADLEPSPLVKLPHIAEALHFRCLDSLKSKT